RAPPSPPGRTADAPPAPATVSGRRHRLGRRRPRRQPVRDRGLLRRRGGGMAKNPLGRRGTVLYESRMATLQDQIRIIIEELTRLQTIPAAQRNKDDNFPLPRMLGVGNGRSIVLSRKIDDMISMVADQLLAADSSLSSKVTRAEWHALVRQALGPALAMIDLDVDPAENAKIVLAEIRTVLSTRVTSYSMREFAFGCTLFGNTAIKPFSIGPVRFESRLEWLARKSTDGSVSATTRRR